MPAILGRRPMPPDACLLTTVLAVSAWLSASVAWLGCDAALPAKLEPTSSAQTDGRAESGDAIHGANSGWTFVLVLSSAPDLQSSRDVFLSGLAGQTSRQVDAVVLAGDNAVPRLSWFDGSRTEIPDYDASHSGQPRTLRTLGELVRARRPGARVALILSGHGKGWRGFGALGRARGAVPGWSLVDGGLEGALAQFVAGLGRNIDLLGFDACSMGTWEVASTVAPYADVFVASAELVPSNGWPMSRVLTRAQAVPGSTARQLSAEIAREFRNAGRHHVLLTALDTSRIATLDTALDALARVALETSCELRPDWLAQVHRYRDADSVDLAGLATALERRACSQALRIESARVRAALADSRLEFACQGAYCETGGLSIYVPVDRLDYTYLDGAAPWNRHARWSKWLAASAHVLGEQSNQPSY